MVLNTLQSPGSVRNDLRRVDDVNEDQQSENPYHEDRLLSLIAQRTKLPADSDQFTAMDIEIAGIWDLVR
ncbi:MAG: hypothetical protein QOH35_3642, partial [Acidobacteriaceae bacterium]|nr:hypothetical protein [Acidobacteriaceae bacterium]